MIFRIILIVFGATLIADTFIVSMLSNINLGVLMPAIIGLPLLLVGIFYGVLHPWWQSNLLGKLLKWAMIAAYSLFGALFAFTTVLVFTNSKAPNSAGEPNVIIVLGAGINGQSPTVVLRNRLDRAIQYYNADPEIILIVSGGQGEQEECTESSVMKAYLVSKGVPEERIIEENRSVSTEENFRFSYEIIKEKFGENVRIAFVTTRFHVFRAKLIAKKQGIKAFGIPASDFPLVAFNNYLRECAALTQYFLTGRI